MAMNQTSPMGEAVDVPLFYGDGDDPERWVSWVEAYGSDQRFSDLDLLRFASGFVEGDALTWLEEENAKYPFESWVELKRCLLKRFRKDKSTTVAALKPNPKHLNLLAEIKQVVMELKQLRASDSNPTTLQDERAWRLDRSETKPTEADTVAQNVDSAIGFPPVREEKLFHEEETGEQKQIEVKMAKDACQVFDRMTEQKSQQQKKKKWCLGRKKVKHKAKRHTYMGTTMGKDEILGAQHLVIETPWKHQGMRRRMRRKIAKLSRHVRKKLFLHKVLMKKKNTQMGMKAYCDQVVVDRLLENIKIATAKKIFCKKWQKRKKFRKAKRSKFKCGKVNVLTRHIHKRKTAKSQDNKRILARWELHSHAWKTSQMFGKWFLFKLTKKKKFRRRFTKKEIGIGIKVSCCQVIAALLSSKKQGKIKKRATFRDWKKRKRFKYKNRHKKVVMFLYLYERKFCNQVVARKWKRVQRTKIQFEGENDTMMNINCFLPYMMGLLRVTKGKKKKKKKKKKRLVKRKKRKLRQRHNKLNRKKLEARLNGVTHREIFERPLRSQNMRRMKGSRGVKCCYMVLSELLLWELRVKKKKPQIQNKKDCCQMLNDVLLNKIKGATRKETHTVKCKEGKKLQHKFKQVKGDMLMTLHNRGYGKQIIPGTRRQKNNVEREMCSWKRLVQLRNVRNKGNISSCPNSGLCDILLLDEIGISVDIPRNPKGNILYLDMKLFKTLWNLKPPNLLVRKRWKMEKRSQKERIRNSEWTKNIYSTECQGQVQLQDVDDSRTETGKMIRCKLRNKGRFVMKLLTPLCFEVMGIKPLEETGQSFSLDAAKKKAVKSEAGNGDSAKKQFPYHNLEDKVVFKEGGIDRYREFGLHQQREAETWMRKESLIRSGCCFSLNN